LGVAAAAGIGKDATMIGLKKGLFAAFGFIGVALVAFFAVRPDPAAEAERLAAALALVTGQPTRVLGTAEIDYDWPLRLRVPRIEMGALGHLERIESSGDMLTAAAELLGRKGIVSADAQSWRFAGEGVVFSRARDGAGWHASFRMAGRDLKIAGLSSDIALDWGGTPASGTLGWKGSDIAFEVAGNGLTLAGIYAPQDDSLVGQLSGSLGRLGDVTGAFRATAELLDVAELSLADAKGAFRLEAGRTAIDMRIDAADIARLGAFVGALPLGDLDLRLRLGKVSWSGGEAEGIVLSAARDAGRIAIDEFAVRAIGGAQLRVRDGLLDLQAADGSRFLRALGVGVERHLGALVLRGRLDVAPDRAALAPLELSLGGQRVTGSLGWREGRLAAQLVGDRVDLGPFFGKPATAPPERGPLLTRSQTARAVAASQPPPPGPGGWSRVPIQFDLAGGMPLDLQLAARTLVFDTLSLADAQLVAAFDANGVAITRLVGGFWGGRLEMAGRIVPAPQPRFALDVALADAELRHLGTLFGNPLLLRGPLTLRGRLESRGRDAAEMASGLAGELRLAVPTGTLDGADLGAVAERLAAGTRAPDLIELGRVLARGGRSDFRSLAGSWQIAQGRARTADMRLALRNGTLDIGGEVDLANWRLDLALGISPNPASGAGAGVRAQAILSLLGPADRPRLNLALKPLAPSAR
jgi:hypothetical protein